MSVKIRLARRGRKKKPFYHIIIADARAPRDGKFIEQIGSYNPMTVPATIEIDRDKAYEWLMKGAQPTNTVRAILKFKGVFYRKHLMRGVAKGSFSEEKAMEMYNEWIEAKEAKIAARKEQTKKEKEEFWKMVSGEIKPAKAKADVAAAEAFREGGDEATEAPAGDAEAAPAAEAKEAAPAAEAAAPAAEEKKAEAVKEEKAPEPAKEEVKEEAKPEAKEEPKAAEPIKEEAKPEVKEEPKAAVEEVKEEAKSEVEAAAPVAAAAAAVTGAAVAADKKPDDLTKIEGVGPAIAKLLSAAGMITFSDLAAKPVEDVKQVLTDAGSRFQMHDPASWPLQADMAAKGKWDELNKWQDEHDGGKLKTSSSEEE